MNLKERVVPLRREDNTGSTTTPENPFAPFFEEIRRIVREELQTLKDRDAVELLTPEALAERLRVPISWVYEQSRQDRIPTHRIGRYIRFDLTEVLNSQKKQNLAP